MFVLPAAPCTISIAIKRADLAVVVLRSGVWAGSIASSSGKAIRLRAPRSNFRRERALLVRNTAPPLANYYRHYRVLVADYFYFDFSLCEADVEFGVLRGVGGRLYYLVFSLDYRVTPVEDFKRTQLSQVCFQRSKFSACGCEGAFRALAHSRTGG